MVGTKVTHKGMEIKTVKSHAQNHLARLKDERDRVEGNEEDRQGEICRNGDRVDVLNNLPNSIAVLCKSRLTDGSDQLNNRSKTGLSEGLTNSS